MEIRKSLPADNAAIFQLNNKVLAHHRKIDAMYTPMQHDPHIDFTADSMVAFVAHEGEEPIIAFVAGKIITDPIDRSTDYAIIQTLWVDPEYRQQGLASRLVATFEQYAKTASATYIDINVDTRNTQARDFWNTTGYQAYQERRKKSL